MASRHLFLHKPQSSKLSRREADAAVKQRIQARPLDTTGAGPSHVTKINTGTEGVACASPPPEPFVGIPGIRFAFTIFAVAASLREVRNMDWRRSDDSDAGLRKWLPPAISTQEDETMKDINSMNMRWRSGSLAGLVFLLPAIGFAQEEGVVEAPSTPSARAAAMVRAYWTAERMETAKAMPVPTVPMAAGAKATRALPPDALPGWAPGWAPGSGAQPKAGTVHWMPEEEYIAAEAAKLEPQHGAEPMNPRDGPYAPFQRWTWDGKYITYPMSTVGKLFFTLPGLGNFVCSASVIGRSTIATAGHCVSDGSGGWATNMLFCPSFRRVGGGAPHPNIGCWAGVTQATSGGWHNNSDFDRDYGCIVTATTGTVRANKIGNVTGWTGRAWNWYGVMELAYGYPAAAPFPGYNIIVSASPDWYTHDWGGNTNQYAKFIGNDSTGGSSGGPWWLAYRHRALEYADTDGNNATDPGQPFGPYINGVNSHKRCAGGTCQSPPTTTAGVFWQEMGSSAFRNTTGDGGESEDVFALCLNHSNNDA